MSLSVVKSTKGSLAQAPPPASDRAAWSMDADAEQVRLHRAVAAIDAVNAADPNRLRVAGTDRPKAQAEGELVSGWVRRLRPDASDALVLAARAHHIRRWTVPRSTYPDGRAGYLRWRRDLHELHAAEAATVLQPLGYDPATVERVQHLVRKRDLATDPDVQTLEDALCLVFLETQFGDLAARLDHAKLVGVLRKTAAKMSPAGLAALADADLSPAARAALAEATG